MHELRVLLVGFGPFPGAPFNPSALLVRALARRRRPAFANLNLTTHVFATTYDAVDVDLPKLFADRPDIVLMFGLAGRRRALCIETRARNAASLLFPDAGGFTPRRGDILPGGPPALRGPAPFADLLGAVRSVPMPMRLSRDAGRYLCNYAYWHALRRVRDRRPLVQFVHIPPVVFAPRQRRRGNRLASFRLVVAAAERLLVALVAASRR
jgi:pyroglutamyl-peptidase